MRKKKLHREPTKNYFPLPNGIYQLGLSAGAIAVYGYLLYIENRKTYQCHASYATIGSAVGMSRNTVRKYVQELERRGLILTERTTIITQDGRIQNGSLLYTILPIQLVIEQFYQEQLEAVDIAREQQCALLQRQVGRGYPIRRTRSVWGVFAEFSPGHSRSKILQDKARYRFDRRAPTKSRNAVLFRTAGVLSVSRNCRISAIYMPPNAAIPTILPPFMRRGY